MSDEPVRKTPFTARCGGCGHTWPAGWLPMELSKFARLCAALHCPNCGEGPRKVFVASPSSKETI